MCARRTSRCAVELLSNLRRRSRVRSIASKAAYEDCECFAKLLRAVHAHTEAFSKNAVFLPGQKKLPSRSLGSPEIPEMIRQATGLDAEGTATAASALDVRVVELEASTLEGLDVVDLNSIQIHLAHLVDQDLDTVELVNVVRRILLTIKGHVVAEPRTSAAHDRHTQCRRSGILLSHDLFHFMRRGVSQLKHF